MRIVMPIVTINGDRENAMGLNGQIVGVNKRRAVWRFGFMPNSKSARAYGVSSPAFLYILAFHDGSPVDTFEGVEQDFPIAFEQVMCENL